MFFFLCEVNHQIDLMLFRTWIMLKRIIENCSLHDILKVEKFHAVYSQRSTQANYKSIGRHQIFHIILETMAFKRMLKGYCFSMYQTLMKEKVIARS